MTFSEKLKQAMQELHLNQRQVCGMTGKSKGSVSQYLSGKQIPSDDVQSAIAVALGLESDYSYLDKAISRGKLDATVRTVLKQDNEDKQWDLYCAITANPLADDVGNFEEFKQRFMSTAPKVEKTEQTEPTMNNAQIKLQVEKANKILNGFVPPLKGGG